MSLITWWPALCLHTVLRGAERGCQEARNVQKLPLNVPHVIGSTHIIAWSRVFLYGIWNTCCRYFCVDLFFFLLRLTVAPDCLSFSHFNSHFDHLSSFYYICCFLFFVILSWFCLLWRLPTSSECLINLPSAWNGTLSELILQLNCDQ